MLVQYGFKMINVARECPRKKKPKWPYYLKKCVLYIQDYIHYSQSFGSSDPPKSARSYT